jgi:exoribonuclease-2
VLRLAEIPLVVRMPGMPAVARGSHVKLDVLRWDEVDLNLETRLQEGSITLPAEPEAELDEEETPADPAQPTEADAEQASLASETVVTEPGPQKTWGRRPLPPAWAASRFSGLSALT